MKRKATYQPERRTHIAHARMNDAEWEQFLSQLEKLGVSQSDFIRQAILTAQVKVTVQPIYNSEVLDEIAAQYGKIGSNLNQIAHHLNAGNPLTARLMKDINHCLADLSGLKQKLENLAGDM
ncbi:MAG: plasmid mobilization relaxosome protein MobC [Lachnospiraceae bacterium]|nr:plasmid mobilization relaxosome protein MobC [Lachnospiraceae bacterium]